MCTRGVGVQERGDKKTNLGVHIIADILCPAGEAGAEMLKAFLLSILTMDGQKRRFHVHPLNVVSQTFKCFTGYALKQRDDPRGHFRMVSKGVSATWLSEAYELYQAHKLTSLEGRIPLTRRNTLEEMFRYYQTNFANLPYIPTLRQLLKWSIQSKSHVPKGWCLAVTGRGFSLQMAEAEFIMMTNPSIVTYEHIDALFYAQPERGRYTDVTKRKPLTADAGILGNAFTAPPSDAPPRPRSKDSYENLSYKQALDISNSKKSQIRRDARDDFGDDVDGGSISVTSPPTPADAPGAATPAPTTPGPPAPQTPNPKARVRSLYVRDEICMYRHSHKVKIIKVHNDGIMDPYYTIQRESGTELQTTGGFLAKLAPAVLRTPSPQKRTSGVGGLHDMLSNMRKFAKPQSEPTKVTNEEEEDSDDSLPDIPVGDVFIIDRSSSSK